MYDCPCGKQHKSRNTVWKHKKRLAAASNDATKTVQKDVQKDVLGGQEKDVLKGQDSANRNQGSTPPSQGQSSIKEIDMVEELGKKKEQVEPKEKKYKCANCGHETDERTKHCPECGVQW